MFFVSLEGGREAVRAEADELPGAHAPLRLAAAQLPRPAVPVRRVVDAAPRRARGHAARAAARPPRHAGRRPHLLLRRPDRGRDLRLPRLRRLSLRPLRPRPRTFELSTRPEKKVGTDEEWDFTEARCAAALERRGIDYARQRGRRRVLRPEDRPAHDGRARPLLADGDDPARRADAAAVRPHLHGRRQPASTRRTSSTARCSARSSASSGSSSSTTAAPSRSGSRRCRCGCCRSARRHTEGARAIAAKLRERGFRVDVGEADRDDRQADPDRRAREDPLHGRLRRPGERARAWPSASAAAASLRRVLRNSRPGLLRLTPEKQGRTRSSPPGPIERRSCGVQPSRQAWDEEAGRCMQRLFCAIDYEEE